MPSAVLPNTAHTSEPDQGLSHLLQQSWDSPGELLRTELPAPHFPPQEQPHLVIMVCGTVRLCPFHVSLIPATSSESLSHSWTQFS